MRNIIVTYLAINILFQGFFSYTSIFFQLDELIEDYQLHQIKYNDDFQTFISKHFGDLKEQHQEQHKKEHSEHKHNDMEIQIHYDYLCSNLNFILSRKIEITSKQTNFYYEDLFCLFEKQKIFQPPKVYINSFLNTICS
jgi:hypothetical protein